MAPVGPQLPPHLTEKRKRSEDDDTTEKPTRAHSSSPDSDSKRQRTIGPTLPHAPLDERPPSSPKASPDLASNEDEETSSDDDDFGPSLPTSGNTSKPASHAVAPAPEPAAPSQRDSWMLVPPTGGDWTSRVDPTKLKARKFNTSKSASTPKYTSTGAADTWNETTQEKHARLQREMMGIKDPSTTSKSSTNSKPMSRKDAAEDAVDADTRNRMKEYAAARGPSLYDAHQKTDRVEKDDDPSARAFDREKDIGGGSQLNSTQRRDLLKKSSDFSSRFSSAKYL